MVNGLSTKIYSSIFFIIKSTVVKKESLGSPLLYHNIWFLKFISIFYAAPFVSNPDEMTVSGSSFILAMVTPVNARAMVTNGIR